MKVAYIGIGSNVGDRTAFVRRAVGELASHPAIEVEATSSLYETSPIGGPPQRSFINVVVRIATDLDARNLLESCQSVERRLGREPSEIRWGPRVVDLDILLYDQDKIGETDLEVPHPRMRERRFVLIPLLEIDPDVTDPWGTPLRDSLDEAEGDVELIEPF
ncbi:MAG: 2-amino-4-hydroxy-6-hydroxymethyldihydropteridine diphosphokinase [Actinomycetota bacterium]|nr:2-amino-4-hydroxy-6-hydroxymethyldihydropteridine diphosphokinase [Actinomycetota bacterium]MEA2487789.1 2-amino-4-hydroxy-6-hydroxymethyldihydropteridine diphosphokinase [Actinomycetota bacterium]